MEKDSGKGAYGQRTKNVGGRSLNNRQQKSLEGQSTQSNSPQKENDDGDDDDGGGGGGDEDDDDDDGGGDDEKTSNPSQF